MEPGIGSDNTGVNNQVQEEAKEKEKKLNAVDRIRAEYELSDGNAISHMIVNNRADLEELIQLNMSTHNESADGQNQLDGLPRGPYGVYKIAEVENLQQEGRSGINTLYWSQPRPVGSEEAARPDMAPRLTNHQEFYNHKDGMLAISNTSVYKAGDGWKSDYNQALIDRGNLDKLLGQSEESSESKE